LQTRKSIGGRQGSDDDDFKPIKAAAKRKAPSKAGPSKQNNDDGDGKQAPAAPKRKAVAKKPVKDESDFDEDDMEVVKRPAPAPVASKRKVVAKKVVKDESDSDSDVQVVEPPRKRPVIDSDSEEIVLPSKSKGKGKA
jgi:DNA topoisomerase-2